MTNEQAKQIESGLRAIGFLFPETISQVEAFEKVFGNPDINFPVEEMDLMFEKIMKRLNEK